MTGANAVDVLIQPFCLRFSLHRDEIVYLVAGIADRTTTLIRGEKTIVVDPGNHHIGFYDTLRRALGRFGLTPADIDLVICSHSHHDHMASIFLFRGTPMILGAGEVQAARDAYGAEEMDARLRVMGPITEVPFMEELEVAPGVRAISTPGHTPGHISVLVEAGAERVVIAGDAVMTRSEYVERRFSHWYGAEQLAQVNESADRLQACRPTRLLFGHDRELRL